MRFKYSAAVLTGVALSAWSASSMATVGSLHKDIMPSSYASGGMNATHVPVSSNQRSLSNAEMKARTISDEERGRLPAGTLGEKLIGMIERLGKEHPDLFDSNLFTSTLFINVYHIAKGNRKKMNMIALDKTIAMFSKNGRKKLAEFAVAATKMDGEKKELAEAMLSNMFTVWKNDDTFDPKNVFEILELHQTNGNVLRHPLFSVWVSYVKLKYPSFKEAQEMMFATLEHFGKSDDLVDLFFAGGTIKSIGRVVDSLLFIQLEKWKKQWKSAKDVFLLLRLEQTEGNLFENPLFTKWTHYLHEISNGTKLRRQRMFTVLEEMCAERLVSVLLLGAKNERTQVFAYDLLNIQLEKWKMHKKVASEAFELLELKQAEGSLFMNPIFFKWKNTYFGSSMKET